MEMNLTEQQQAFIQAVSYQPTALRSVAGSGKTTVMVFGVENIVEIMGTTSIAAVAFNKQIATTLDARMPDGVTSKTMHAMGFGAWAKANDFEMNVDQYKNQRLYRELFRKKDEDEDEEIGEICRLVGLAKNSGLIPENRVNKARHPALCDDMYENWVGLIETHELDIVPSEYTDFISAAQEILTAGIDEAFEGNIDFDDMLYMPVLFGGIFRVFRYVLIDEAQDISAIQRIMLAKILEPNGLLTAVGDPNQAIYAFRGADSNAFDLIKEDFGLTQMNLTCSFRCPQDVVKEAQKYVPDITFHNGAPKGKVWRRTSFKIDDFSEADAVLCRNAAPLLDIAFKLVKDGRPVNLLGRDIGKNLNGLIRKINPKDFGATEEAIRAFKRQEVQKYKSLNMHQRAEAVIDRCDCLMYVVQSMPDESTIADLKKRNLKLFESRRGGTTFGTIHGMKGLEFDRVFFLDSWRIPSKYATTEAALQQESNLAYVGTTRAINELHFIDTERVE